MKEIELKFQVSAARREAVAREVVGRRASAPLRLQAAYFDTADRALARAGLALRLRREGLRWVQTLKGAGTDGLTRAEHNVPRAGRTAALPALDVGLHAGTPVGERLLALLHDLPDAALACLYRTDIRRTRRLSRTRLGDVESKGQSTVELAFDMGHIAAGERRVPVCELEIELVRGHPGAVIEAARRWVARHGVWLDTRSKAERGDLLARDQTQADPRRAVALVLRAEMSVAEGRRAVLASCLDQVSINASQVAAGEFGDDHVHQLRVGLRRLRSALRLFDEGVPDPMLAEPAAALFRQLGAARDQAAVAAPLQLELQRALQAIAVALPAPKLPTGAEAADPPTCVRAVPTQMLLLDLLAAVQGEGAAAAAPAAIDLQALISKRLNRWHRKVAADVARFAELDDLQRHALRKRAKRLRYAVEFGAALFDAGAVRRYLKPLRRLQEQLGALNDVAVALDGYRQTHTDDPNALFALGWLAARRETLLQGGAPALKAFAKAKRFWR